MKLLINLFRKAKLIDYKVLDCLTDFGLKDQILKHLCEGYLLHGNIFGAPDENCGKMRFYQCVVKLSKEREQ